MAYCTYTDVQLKAGTSCGTATTADITNLIVESDAEICALAHQSMSMLMTLNPVPLTEEDIYKMFCALK